MSNMEKLIKKLSQSYRQGNLKKVKILKQKITEERNQVFNRAKKKREQNVEIMRKGDSYIRGVSKEEYMSETLKKIRGGV